MGDHGEKKNEYPHPRSKRREFDFSSSRQRVFNRRNTLGMNTTVCLCLCVRRVEKEGGNGIRGNTFGRGGRAT